MNYIFIFKKRFFFHYNNIKIKGINYFIKLNLNSSEKVNFNTKINGFDNILLSNNIILKLNIIIWDKANFY